MASALASGSSLRGRFRAAEMLKEQSFIDLHNAVLIPIK